MSLGRPPIGRLALSAVVAASLLSTACASDAPAAAPAVEPGAGGSAAVAALVVTSGVDTLRVGQSGRLAAVAVDAAGRPLADRAVRWTGSAPEVAAIGADGEVLARAAGSVTATATSGERSITVTLVVTPTVESIARAIELLPRAVVLAPGNSHPLAARVRDAAGTELTGARVRWSSTDTLVASVDDAGTVRARAAGEVRIVAVVGSATAELPVRVDAPAASAFTLDLRLVGSAQSLGDDAARAAARWTRVIAGDLPDVAVALPANTCGFGIPTLAETVDDVLLVVLADTLDGPGGTIASASPCVVRQQSGLPVLGVVRIDAADLAELRAAGLVESVLAHEIGHVLGVGTEWRRDAARPLVTDLAGASPAYVGERARAAAASLGFTGSAAAPVPVENDGGSATRGMHWRESVFARELMTGWLDDDAPLSAVTVGALADLGYDVRESGADAFSVVLAGTRDAASVLAAARAPATGERIEAPRLWVH